MGGGPLRRPCRSSRSARSPRLRRLDRGSVRRSRRRRSSRCGCHAARTPEHPQRPAAATHASTCAGDRHGSANCQRLIRSISQPLRPSGRKEECQANASLALLFTLKPQASHLCTTPPEEGKRTAAHQRSSGVRPPGSRPPSSRSPPAPPTSLGLRASALRSALARTTLRGFVVGLFDRAAPTRHPRTTTQPPTTTTATTTTAPHPYPRCSAAPNAAAYHARPIVSADPSHYDRATTLLRQRGATRLTQARPPHRSGHDTSDRCERPRQQPSAGAPPPPCLPACSINVHRIR